MEQTLQRILAGVYVLIGLVGVLVIPLVYIILSQLERGNGMPRVNSFQKSLKLAGGLIKRRFSFRVTKQKLKTTAEVVPDVEPELERKAARRVLKLNETQGMDEIKMTNAAWVDSGDWKELGGTPRQFTSLMNRWEDERIIRRVGGKKERAFARPYERARERLEGKVK
jgi:hypothetical protein